MVLVWTAIGVYAAILIGVYLIQDGLVFPGARWGRGQPVPAVQGVRTESVTLPSGARVRVAFGEVSHPVGVLLFFVGNGEDLRSGVQWAGEMTGYGVDTVVPEYPGYGDSEGKLGVAAFYAAADAVADLAERRAGELGVPLLVGGSSLGTFSAVHLARAGRGERLLLLAPPTSVADVGSRHYWWLPVRWLIRYRFDNMQGDEKVHCPVLVVHGSADATVPLDMGRRVAARLGADLIVAEGAGHTRAPLMPSGPYAGRIRAFLTGG